MQPLIDPPFMQPVVELIDITKQFGALTANAGIDLMLHEGRIHALLGENGAGKSTLSKILYGLYQPTTGTILIDGATVRFASPADAIRAGIGMVTQHFALVPNFTVTENVILGLHEGVLLQRDKARARVCKVAESYGLRIDPDAQVGKLSVGEQQRVEILKALYRDCRVLILDEPTAVLTPRESDALFLELKTLVAQQLAVVFISHKLDEVIAHCDEVTVLRAGRVVAQHAIRDTDAASLAREMVGRDLLMPERAPRAESTGAPVLHLYDLTLRDARGVNLLAGVNLSVNTGEIVGLAGVAGNGQRELADVLSGMQTASAGSYRMNGQDLTHANAQTITRAGVGRIHEDRFKSIIAGMSVAYNLAFEDLARFTRNGVLDQKAIRQNAEALIAEYEIKAQPGSRVGRLSGGNIQKVVLARTLSRQPLLVIAAQPTRGLDVGAIEYVHGKLREARANGAAVLLISEDLDEILKLSDRIAVMSAGRIVGEVAAADATLEQLGMLMGGVVSDGN